MATNKNALLRFKTLDKCFKNFYKKYYFDDLLDRVNEALLEDDINNSGILTRQLRDDIRYMKSESGYNAPIEAYRNGRKAYYRYSEKEFSINKSPLNDTELNQMKNALSLLQRFEGSKGFEWISEITTILEDSFGLTKETNKVVSFENNIDYIGYIHITKLFNSIVNKNVLTIKYAPFGKEPFELEFHPHYLKQYNNRWFVFGLNPDLKINKWNMALDRIESISISKSKFISSYIDWEYHFSEIIGVTKPQDAEEIEIELLFTKELAPYIQTKPLHQSHKQKITENGLYVKYKLIPNYELEQLLLSFGERVKVLSPASLIHSIKTRLELGANQY